MPILEELDQQNPGEKPTNVRPHGDPAAEVRAIRQLRQGCDELPEEPPDQDQPCRDRDDLEENARLASKKTGEKVKFKWVDEEKKDTEYYFELRNNKNIIK